jgi:hypothetical protein
MFRIRYGNRASYRAAYPGTYSDRQTVQTHDAVDETGEMRLHSHFRAAKQEQKIQRAQQLP